MQAPAALVSIPFLTGCIAGVVLAESLPGDVTLCAAGAAMLALIAATAAALDELAPEATVCIVAGALLVGVSLGVTSARCAYASPLRTWFDARLTSQPAMVEGILREDAAPAPFGASLTIDVVRADRVYLPRDRPLGGLRLSISGVLAADRVRDWRAGRRIRAPAVLRVPASYRNPGVPDLARGLARRGVALVGSVKSAALVEVVAPGSILHESAAAVRAWTRVRLLARIGRWSARSGAIANAILIGDRTGLTAEDERRLQEAGTFHVIAISGGNIAILTALLLIVLRTLSVPYRFAAAFVIIAVLFYGEIAGGAASVGRAVAAAVIFLAGRLLDHRGAPLNILAVVAGLAAAVSPLVVLDPGFILSFGATLGILIGAPRFLRASRAVHWTGRAVVGLLAATVCAEIALAPVSAAVFSRVTFAGLALNFVAIPLMTMVQVAGGVVLAFTSLSNAVADAAAYLSHLSAVGLVDSARLVDVVPWLSVEVRPPAWWLIAAYYMSAAALVSRRARRVAAAILAATGALILSGPDYAVVDAVPAPATPIRVVVLDVGQGDATLVTLPLRRSFLVDAGGLAGSSSPAPGGPEAAPAFDVGDRVVRGALRALGVKSLEAIVLTHGDPDHVLGAPGLLERVGARAVWEGVAVPGHAGLRALSELASRRGASWRTVQAGDSERFREVEIRVLHPPPPDWERQRVRNEDSVVLEVRIGRVSIVLPGDIGREGERGVIPRLEAGRLVVLKAPHHGSATSSTKELLEHLRPAAVIFSAGRDNRFGHPHPAVVARYQAIGAEIFRTDRDGAVFVETDGTKVEVWGWVGRRVVLGK